MAKILLLDNYDSFTYNLLHYLEDLTSTQIEVVRNDQVKMESLEGFDSLIVSPGPGLPKKAGQLMEVLHYFIQNKKKVLGVCLGQQAIAEYFRIELKNLRQVVHGKSSILHVTDLKHSLFQQVPSVFPVGRYHSWVAEIPKNHPEIQSIAADEQGNCMALSHRRLPIMAVQFHPESVLTEYGKVLLKNWLEA